MSNFPNKKNPTAPKDNPKESIAMVLENRHGVSFKKFVSLQVQHGDEVHVLDANFPMINLTTFSPKIAEFFANNPGEMKYSIKASAHLPYDSMPYHRVIDLIRRTDTSSYPGRKDVALKVTGLSLAQIAQALWFCQVNEIEKPLNQDWIGEHIIKQFPKDQGVAQLDVAALSTILWLFSEKGKVQPAALKSMKSKIGRNKLSAAELVKLAELRNDFPQYDSYLGGLTASTGTAQAPPAAPVPQAFANGGIQTSPRPAQSPAQPKKLTDDDFPPLGGGRR